MLGLKWALQNKYVNQPLGGSSFHLITNALIFKKNQSEPQASGLPVLTDAWRRSGEGVALVLSAAVDEEAVEGGVAVLPVDAVGEAAPLLVASHPGVEADVSSAGAVHARLLLVLARAQELPIVVGVWGEKKTSVVFESKREEKTHEHILCNSVHAGQ